MNIRIVCVGKLKERYFEDACADYGKRLLRYCTLELVEVPDEKAPETLSPAAAEQVRARECARALMRIRPTEHVIALTIDGARYASEAFAARLCALSDGGRTVTFLIGGSLGLSREALARANERLSLSDLTLPHRLARLVLLEQIYRAHRINAGEPYHK